MKMNDCNFVEEESSQNVHTTGGMGGGGVVEGGDYLRQTANSPLSKAWGRGFSQSGPTTTHLHVLMPEKSTQLVYPVPSHHRANHWMNEVSQGNSQPSFERHKRTNSGANVSAPPGFYRTGAHHRQNHFHEGGTHLLPSKMHKHGERYTVDKAIVEKFKGIKYAPHVPHTPPHALGHTYTDLFPHGQRMILYAPTSSNGVSTMDIYCKNCGKQGHMMYQCKNPITSYGVIAFRYVENAEGKKERQYLMIRRRNTIGYIDFLRGKYSLYNKKYVKNLIQQMTKTEIDKIINLSFEELWYDLWKEHIGVSRDEVADVVESNPSLVGTEAMMEDTTSSLYNQYVIEKHSPRDQFNILRFRSSSHDTGGGHRKTSNVNLFDIIQECKNEGSIWDEPEWGFCKGRRNFMETDYDCALREMEEETGYAGVFMKRIKNIYPFEEIFVGSNNKSYRHKYYLMYMKYEDSLIQGNFQRSEVSCVKWCSFDECVKKIRKYNVEKIQMITQIERCLNKYTLI